MQEWEPPVLRRMLRDPQWRMYSKLVKRRLIRTLVNLATLEVETGNRKLAYRYAWEIFKLKPIGKAYLSILGAHLGYEVVDCFSFLKEKNKLPSMSRRGNCHNNAVVESFSATFKKRVNRRKIYATRAESKTEVINFIEMLYIPIKGHTSNGGLSPNKFEQAYFER